MGYNHKTREYINQHAVLLRVVRVSILNEVQCEHADDVNHCHKEGKHEIHTHRKETDQGFHELHLNPSLVIVQKKGPVTRDNKSLSDNLRSTLTLHADIKTGDVEVFMKIKMLPIRKPSSQCGMVL